MQLHLGSKRLAADVNVALDVSGREHLVIVAKGTWSIPGPGQRPKPLPADPLVAADEFYGEPGESPLRYGSDFARFKPHCDVVFDACAHALDGKPVTQMDVQLRVGSMNKLMRVHGARRWQRLLGVTAMTDAEPFTSRPLHFGLAFGGARWYEKGDDRLCEALLTNPAGLGFAGRNTISQMHGEPAPSLEAPREAVSGPSDKRAPVALSPIARHWSPRRELAGTYDDAWRENVFPFLPEDFDEAFNQIAPADQQIAYPTGGEPVELSGVLPGRAQLSFVLPQLAVGVRVLRDDYSVDRPDMKVDTLFFDLPNGRFSAVWRASVPIKRRLQEFQLVAVGPVDEAWWAAQSMGLDGTGCPGCRQPSLSDARSAA